MVLCFLVLQALHDVENNIYMLQKQFGDEWVSHTQLTIMSAFYLPCVFKAFVCNDLHVLEGITMHKDQYPRRIFYIQQDTMKPCCVIETHNPSKTKNFMYCIIFTIKLLFFFI